MENVKGMLGVANQVKEDFEAIGYSVECKVFNAKDFAKNVVDYGMENQMVFHTSSPSLVAVLK